MNQRNCIKFGVKNEIISARTFLLTVAFSESTMSTTEYTLNCGITGLRKIEISMTMLALVARARQQSMRTLKQ